MGEKFRRAVNAPHQAFGRARKKITAMQPKTKRGKVARATGITMTGLFQFLLWAVKYAALDNHLTRGMEQKLRNMTIGKNKRGENKKISSFAKTYPNLSSHMLYYMMLMMVAGGVKAYDAYSDKDADTEPQQKEIVKEKSKDTSVKKMGTWQIDPNADDATWQSQIKAIEPYILAHVRLSEGVFKRVYYDKGKSVGTKTVGIGFTVQDKKHIDFAKRVLGRDVSRDGETVSWDEADRLALQWLRQEVYPRMKKNFTSPMDAKLFVILAVAAYNKGEKVYDGANSGKIVRDAVNSGVRGIDLANIYVRAFGGTRGTQWGGLSNKYGVCALYYIGKISDETILNSIAESPYALEPHLKEKYKNSRNKNIVPGRLLIYEGQKNNAKPVGFLGPKDIESLLLYTKNRVTKGEKQLPVRRYMKKGDVQKMIRGELFADSNAVNKNHGGRKAMSKQTVFNYGAKKLGNNAHSADFNIADIVFDGRDMA